MSGAPRLAFVLFCAGAVCAVAGCTFLVSFDDVPAADDAGAPPRDASSDVRDSALPDATPIVDAGSDTGPTVPVTPPCDTAFPLSKVEGCSTFIDNAQVCADNTSFTSYPGTRATDVVTCTRSNGAICVRHCTLCAHNPKGYPDQCDQCSTKSDGKYCGDDMGWQPTNAKLLVTCSGGRMTSSAPCSNGCDSKGGAGSAACN